jgi:hypothetical protein
MALRSTQHLTEMSTRNLQGGKERPAYCLEKVGTSTSENPMGLHGLLQVTFTFTYTNISKWSLLFGFSD